MRLASQHHPIKNGARGNGAKHARYIAGEGPFSARDDVLLVQDGNLPEWAKNAEEFFAAADEHERGDYSRKCKTKEGQEYIKTIKGRAYKEMEIAIPREAPDPVEWAKNLARESIGNQHPYRLAVHDKAAADGGRNVHMHLMFSTRTMDGHSRDKETFFKRAAAPYRDRKTKELIQPEPSRGGAKKSAYWDSQIAVHEHRARFERHVQRVAPEFKLERSDAPEQKIGPKLMRAGPEYERQRVDRSENVTELREAKRERRDIDAEIKREKEIEDQLMQAKAIGEAERKQAAPASLIDLGTDIDAARRERQAKPRGRTDDLFAQLEAKRRAREGQEKDKENPLSDFLQQWRVKTNEARQKPDEPPQKPAWQKEQKTMENQEHAAPEQGQSIDPPPPQRSRTDELFAQLERQRQERDDRDRDSGPELGQ